MLRAPFTVVQDKLDPAKPALVANLGAPGGADPLALLAREPLLAARTKPYCFTDQPDRCLRAQSFRIRMLPTKQEKATEGCSQFEPVNRR